MLDAIDKWASPVMAVALAVMLIARLADHDWVWSAITGVAFVAAAWMTVGEWRKRD